MNNIYHFVMAYMKGFRGGNADKPPGRICLPFEQLTVGNVPDIDEQSYLGQMNSLLEAE